MSNVLEIKGLGRTSAERLEKLNIDSIEELLDTGATPRGRHDMASRAGISESEILDWVRQADLMRIYGVGEEFAQLLEQAGIDSLESLTCANASRLQEQLVHANNRYHLVDVVPGRMTVENWIEQAKQLPEIVQA